MLRHPQGLYSPVLARPRVGDRDSPPRSKDRATNAAYKREWMERPGNRERNRETQRRWREANRDEINARQASRRSEARRLMYEMGLVKSECAVCGGEFRQPGGVGRPRKYCETCVRGFERSDRRCPRCGRTISRGGRRRLTCANCGAVWMPGVAA